MTKEELEKLREEAFWRGDMNEVNRINEQLNIKPKLVNEDAIYNQGFLPEYTITAADPNRPTAPKNVVKTFAYSPIRLSKDAYGNNKFIAKPANPSYRINFNDDFDYYMRTYKPRRFSESGLSTLGLFENNNEFYKTLRQNYIKEHPELKLNPKNY